MSEELKQAAQQALEALEHAEKDAADFQRLNTDQTSVAIKSLRQSLTQRPAAQAGEREAFESVLIDGVAYDLQVPVAAELLRLHLELQALPTQPEAQEMPDAVEHYGTVDDLPAAQAAPAQEVVDERLWDLFIRWETVAFGDFKAEVRAAFDLEPTERDDKRAAFTEWLQTTWPMIYPKGCADDLWRNGHLATLALAWQAHIARKANIAPQFQIARQSPQQAAPEPVGEPFGWLFQHEETGLTKVVDCQQLEWGFEVNNPRWQKIRPVYTHPAPGVPPTKDQIREVFIGNGFTVKEGQADLKPYVYAAADALLKLVSPSPGVPEGFALVPITDLQALAKRAHELRDRQYDVSGSALFGDDKVKNFREQQPLVYAVACEVGVGLFCLADDLDALAAAQAKGADK